MEVKQEPFLSGNGAKFTDTDEDQHGSRFPSPRTIEDFDRFLAVLARSLSTQKGGVGEELPVYPRSPLKIMGTL